MALDIALGLMPRAKKCHKGELGIVRNEKISHQGCTSTTIFSLVETFIKAAPIGLISEEIEYGRR